MADGTYSGDSYSFGDYTTYSSGNSSTKFGEAEFFKDGDIAYKIGSVTHYSKSGGKSMEIGSVTHYYDENWNETGQSIECGGRRMYYGKCGPCTSDTDK